MSKIQELLDDKNVATDLAYGERDVLSQEDEEQLVREKRQEEAEQGVEAMEAMDY